MKKISTITEFKEGQTIQGFFLCVEKHLRHTRGGDLYLDLSLRDKTGQVGAKVWDNIPKFHEKFDPGDPVAVAGEVEVFQDCHQLVVKKINRASVQSYGRYGYDPAMIVPASKADPMEMWKSITGYIKGIKSSHLKQLASQIYKENKDKILVHPGSASLHHAYRSGLLEHTLSMASIAKTIGPHYDADLDLLMTGVLLHDIGKLKEISDGMEFDYTDSGHFIGHIVLGRDMVAAAIKKLKGFPKDLAAKVEHMILSHQGKREWQSPRRPMFKEALLLHLIDYMDAQVNLMDRILEEDSDEGSWTDRRNYFRMPLYRGTKPSSK